MSKYNNSLENYRDIDAFEDDKKIVPLYAAFCIQMEENLIKKRHEKTAGVADSNCQRYFHTIRKMCEIIPDCYQLCQWIPYV